MSEDKRSNETKDGILRILKVKCSNAERDERFVRFLKDIGSTVETPSYQLLEYLISANFISVIQNTNPLRYEIIGDDLERIRKVRIIDDVLKELSPGETP